MLADFAMQNWLPMTAKFEGSSKKESFWQAWVIWRKGCSVQYCCGAAASVPFSHYRFWLDHLRTPWHQKWKYWRHQIFLMGAGDGSSWRLPSCCDSLVGLMWLEYLRVLLICLTQFSSRNQSNIWPIFGWVHGDFWHWPFCYFHGLFHSDDGAPLGGPDRSTAHW